ncbi:Hypothetical predicted protein [Mytilus galloprovincialis]|uniref:Uncharacterized protein n=1 Tax=Mytilus galloprovincialis TaxID=29158 RepID=A0A8B6DMK3_MYTGA|nr:Hypothetical predicted protein [Mytilus galloprovincialis]
MVKGIYNQHDTSVLATNAKDNHSQQNTDPSLSDNIQKKPKRQNIRTMKPKINHAEDKAYTLKLENKINKLKSSLEMQSNLRQQNEQTESASCNINSSQQSSTSNHLNSNLYRTIEQRFRILDEFIHEQHVSKLTYAIYDAATTPIIRQNAYQQHMHHSANYQPLQRENGNNMPPQPRPAVFNTSSDLNQTTATITTTG